MTNRLQINGSFITVLLYSVQLGNRIIDSDLFGESMEVDIMGDLNRESHAKDALPELEIKSFLLGVHIYTVKHLPAKKIKYVLFMSSFIPINSKANTIRYSFH